MPCSDPRPLHRGCSHSFGPHIFPGKDAAIPLSPPDRCHAEFVTAKAGANDSVPAGLLWVDGNGDSRLFTSNGNGTYSNAEDFGSLVQQGSSYVYMAKDQTVYNFSSTGQLTSAPG
jgi:hypothetical protein